MNKYPKISVVTPSYNSAKFIEDCIQSVLKQNYPNFEHIIVDGVSTDGTIKILKKYSHLKWISEPDKGQSDALNKGFKMADGEWILWLNSDDYIENDYFNLFLNKINKNKRFNVCYGHMRFVDENQKQLKIMAQIQWFYLLGLERIYFPPSTGTIFKSDLLKGNLLNYDYHYAMDGEWFLRVGKQVKTFLINAVTFNFRVHRGGKTSRSIKEKIYNSQQILERKSLAEKYYFKPNIYKNILKVLLILYYYLKKAFYFKYYLRHLSI